MWKNNFISYRQIFQFKLLRFLPIHISPIFHQIAISVYDPQLPFVWIYGGPCVNPRKTFSDINSEAMSWLLAGVGFLPANNTFICQLERDFSRPKGGGQLFFIHEDRKGFRVEDFIFLSTEDTWALQRTFVLFKLTSKSILGDKETNLIILVLINPLKLKDF